MSSDILLKLYEEGVITKHELFAQTQVRGHEPPESFLQEYQEWDIAHPPGECLTFSIFA